MINRRGLSDLVSNVLIILLVFASIAIMGVIILNLVKLSGSSIEGATACKLIDVKPVQCIHNVTDANLLFSTEYETGVSITNVDIISLFTDGTQSKQSWGGSNFGNFETQSVRESAGENNYNEFYTVTTFKDKKGVERVCTSTKVKCELFNPDSEYIETIDNPKVCGSAARSYLSNQNSYGANAEFCKNEATLGGTQLFPEQGSYSSWTCNGETCRAFRNAASGGGGGGGGGGGSSNNLVDPTIITKVNGVCGTALNSCAPGSTLSNIHLNDTDNLWDCVGTGGGTTASCNKPRECPVPELTYDFIPGAYSYRPDGVISYYVPARYTFSWMTKLGCYYQLQWASSENPNEYYNLDESVEGNGNLYTLVRSEGESAPDQAMWDLFRLLTSVNAPDTVLSYSFDYNTNDNALYNNNGASGGRLSYITENENTYAHFDGVDDYIQISEDESLKLEEMSVSFWFKNGKGTVISDSTPVDLTNYEFSFIDDSNTILHSSIVKLGNSNELIFMTTDFENPSVWHHYAYIRNKTTQSTYLDGVLISSDSFLSGGSQVGFSDIDAPILIGARPGDGLNPIARFYSGDLDNLNIFNNTLSVNEIVNIYNLEKDSFA